tara:strand:- start:2963 stop:3238 length:276 start_codon:yes stop_codon:yes gene_type:complete
MVQDFLTMCRTIYVPIHGEELVKRVFYPLTEDKLKKMVKIYNTCPAFSWQNIETYLKNNNNSNTVTLRDGTRMALSTFYSNAIQHYILKDY